MRARPQTGMTLLELMVVTAIVGILASIAYPSYREQVRRSSRTEAKVGLEQRAQALEKCFTRFMAYNNANCAAAAAAADANTPNGRYRITLNVGALTPTTYTLQAVPRGAQLDDAECATYQITEAGNRTVTGTLPANRCW